MAPSLNARVGEVTERLVKRSRDRRRPYLDRIDHAIVALMAERGKYVAEAGRFKKDPGAVSAPARVEAIISKVRADAEAQGLDPAVAERTYRAMIAAFEDYERKEWTRRYGQGPAK